MRIFRPTNKWKQAPDNLRREAASCLEDWKLLQIERENGTLNPEIVKLHNAWAKSINARIRNAL